MKKIIKNRDITNNIEPYRLKLLKKTIDNKTVQRSMDVKDMIDRTSQFVERISQQIKKEDDQINELIITKKERQQEAYENFNLIMKKMNDVMDGTGR
ncbi:hypothetical protein AAGG74_19195 [Bacillus mexicanus]|uniref:hypothetical protein n=1 Tax=Bacillus mexicanus TaxID=2834415 RepID=UPI003D1C67A7